MKKKKGFTLIELLAVIVVLGLTFLFVGPKLVSLINDGEDKETKLKAKVKEVADIEQKVAEKIKKAEDKEKSKEK